MRDDEKIAVVGAWLHTSNVHGSKHPIDAVLNILAEDFIARKEKDLQTEDTSIPDSYFQNNVKAPNKMDVITIDDIRYIRAYKLQQILNIEYGNTENAEVKKVLQRITERFNEL